MLVELTHMTYSQLCKYYNECLEYGWEELLHAIGKEISQRERDMV